MVIKNELILDAAASVLAKRPNATLQSIANAAGISRTTIFNKFPTRDALLDALARDTLTRIGEVMAWVPSGEPSVHMDDFVAKMSEITSGLMLLGPRTSLLGLVSGSANDLDAHWVDAVTPLAIYMGRAQAGGLLRGDQPARWLVASYIGLMFAAWDEVAEGELGVTQASRLVVESWMSGASQGSFPHGRLPLNT